MPQTEAQKRAKAKYNAKTYKQLKVNVKPLDYNIIDQYCNKHGISKAAFVVGACKYCIDNNIDLSK